MGVLYLASDPLLQRTVAIKVLSVHNDELRERFAREARSAAALKHNHIVTVYDVGDDGGQPFLAMEYLDGETMAEVIRRRAPFAVTRKLQLLLQLCDGLGYAHRTGIIHRDIKPANLMVTSEGVLKILDFGLARLTNDASGAGLTRVGMLMGTPHYMSPEQIQGTAVDHRSDIFAVGLVAYEFLSYKKAYAGEAPHAVLDRILHSEPQPLLDVRPDLDPRLAAVVNRAIKKDPRERYPSLADMAADLGTIRNHLAALDATVAVVREDGAKGSGEVRSPSTPAIPNYEIIAQRRGAQIALHLDKAQEFFAAGDYLAAIDQCEHAAVLDPDDRRVIDLLQRAHRAADDRQVAEWLSEAQALITQGLLTDADRLIDESLQRRPGSEEAQALQQRVRALRREREMAAERERAALSAIARARTNFEEGAFEAAIRCATEALAHDPRREEALELQAMARRALAERREQEEQDRLAHEAVAAAREMSAAGQIDEALRQLREFAPPHPIVDEAIGRLEAQALELERRRREEAEARRRQQEAEEARRREDERRAREEEARLAREREEARRREIEAEEARRREEERRAREAERLAREAEEARQREREAELARQAAELRRRQEVAAAAKEAARTAIAESRFGDALAALDRARDAVQEDEEIDRLVDQAVAGRAEAEAAERRRQTAGQHVTAGNACIDRGEAAAALRHAAAAVELIPALPEGLELMARARVLLEEQRKADEQKRRANAAASTARRLFVTGDYQGAVRLLEAFTPRALVEPVLEEIHTEWRRQEKRRADAEERRRADEEAARAAVQERERAEAEARARAEAEARAKAEGEARAKAEALEREAAARAGAEAERAARQRAEEEQRRAEEQRQAEEQQRRAAEERQRAEAERQRVAEEQQRAEAERQRAAEEQRAEAERLRAKEEQRRAEEAQRQKQEAERAAARARAQEEAAARRAEKQREREAKAAEKQAAVEPAASLPATVSYRKQAGLAAAALLALAALGTAWWLQRAPTTPDDPTTVQTPPPGDPAPTAPPTEPTPPNPRPEEAALQAATARFEAGDLAAAAGLVAPMAASGSSQVLDLIGRIRGAAAEGSASAHRAADEAGAGTHPDYRNAHRTEASAAGLSGPADIIQAVNLYREAAADFANATAAAREAGQLVRAGTDALQRGDIQRAIAEGTRALDRNPGDKRALELLASVRGRAQAAAMTARTEALKQGAGTSDRFTEAEAARQSAEKNTDPRQTVQQVAAFERARELYLLSAKDIGGRRAEAVRAIASGRSALERGDLQAAESALASALAADPNVDGAGALRSAIAARRKAAADAKPAPPPTNTPPKPTPADPSPTPAAARAADRNAIAETLRAYERAYASLDASEVVKVAPFLAGRLERALANDFRNLRAYSMRIEAAEPTFSPDGNNARVRSKITRNIETRNTGKEPSRVQVSTLILQKRGGQWLITGIETEG